MKKLFFGILVGTLVVLAGCAQQATSEEIIEFSAEDLDAICGAYAATSETEAGAALAPAFSGAATPTTGADSSCCGSGSCSKGTVCVSTVGGGCGCYSSTSKIVGV